MIDWAARAARIEEQVRRAIAIPGRGREGVEWAVRRFAAKWWEQNVRGET